GPFSLRPQPACLRRRGRVSLEGPRALPRAARIEPRGLQSINPEAVLRTIGVQIETEAEEVIVVDRGRVGCDHPPVCRSRRRRLARGSAADGFDLRYAGRADASGSRPSLAESPVEDVIVVGDGGNTAQ